MAWENVAIPQFNTYLEELDKRLMEEVIKPDALFWPMFQFFDSDPENPLTPRELLQFWGVMSEEERLLAMLEFC